jgi:hypothetical protein
MHIVKVLTSVAVLLLSKEALAATSFECGTVSCSAFGSAVITGIDNIAVGGSLYDVTFSRSQDTTFAFSNSVAGAGQALTGVDAANALNSFYGTQVPPGPGGVGPGILASVDGVTMEVFNLVTAYQASKTTPGAVDFDLTTPFLGAPYTPVQTAPELGSGGSSLVSVAHASAGNQCSAGACTVWTKVAAAPEISALSAPAAVTLLLGSLAVLRGRRPRRRAIR